MTAGSFLHVARDDTGVDVEAAERAAADFLAALGIDVDHEDLRETPGRMARAYAELFSSPPLRLTTFANDEGYDELVLARAIPFRTVCEHHLLPFSGVAHVGYLPGERIVGLSKLARLVEHFAAAEAGALRGRAAIANARLAYQHYEQMLASPRWAALAAAGARPQRPLWASTSVKDPAYPDTMYVTKLVAPGVVNTMPEATLRAVADHGQIPADSVRDYYQDARQVLSQLAAAGVDYDDVTAALEQRGLELFDASWRELGDQLGAQLRHSCHH